MKRYSLKEFIDVVERADIVYGQVTLNAADRIPARIKKKTLLESLKSIKKPSLYQEEIHIPLFIKYPGGGGVNQGGGSSPDR